MGLNDLEEGFLRSLRNARNRSATKTDSVQETGREWAARTGLAEFYINRSTVSNYEAGSWPTVPKLLTLARAYQVPLAVFYKALGATDAEICGHVFSEEEKRLIDLLRGSAEHARLHQQLQQILDQAPDEDRGFILQAIRMALERLQPPRDSTEKSLAQTAEEDYTTEPVGNIVPLRRRVKQTSVGVLYGGQAAEHDEPQPIRTRQLPYFEYRIPAGPPDSVPADGFRTVEVLRHLVKETRYCVRVGGDSMAPNLLDGDLVLVDYARKPKNGDFVCALVNGESMVKRYRKKGGQITLESINKPKHRDWPIEEGMDLRIQGVVLRVIERDPYAL